jgi:quinoprotein glucose dehydrogenase
MMRLYLYAAFAATLYCGLASAADSPKIPEGAGKAAFERMCTPCHGLSVITGLRRTQPEWQDTVDNMVRRGASGSNQDLRAVVAYLAAHFGRTESTPAKEQAASPRRVVTVDPKAKQVPGKTDWSMFGHDPGAIRYSRLAQITASNVHRLKRVWTYHTGEPGRIFQMTPLVVNGIMYITAPSQKVVALEPETGRTLWTYDPHVKHGSGGRGVSYWPGDGTFSPRILLPTLDGRLIALDAKTGKPAAGFGDNGELNLRTGFADDYPDAEYSVTSPPAIYKNLAIFGPALQEGPSHGPSGDPRAIDIRTGKLVWRFHVLPRPGEPANDTWGPDGWKNRSGPSTWGFITVDAARGLVFIPVGNPADSFYGADRKGTNLYANSVIALDANTGKLRWHYQMIHHDTFDDDIAAPPALIDVVQNGKKIPAVAEVTKTGLLFILDRMTGKPIFGVEERPVPQSDVPGEESWPTQPFPLKPPPLARNSITEKELSKLSPESEQFCKELLAKYPNHGPYTPYNLRGSSVFPSAIGGPNWGGVSFDPHLGYIFVNVSDIGSIGQMAKTPASAKAIHGEPPMPYRNVNGYARFVDQNHYPCNEPPWGELIAVNASSGDIAWRSTLGSYEELDAKGIPQTGTPSLGGSIVTAGGLVFIGATNDSRFRAFDSRTGKQLWVTKIDASANTTPVTYLGRDGNQYVVIATGGSGHIRSVGRGDDTADSVIAFALQ